MESYKHISIYKIKEARESSERLDAFAFAVCIKLKYSSSVLHKSDIRHLKANFGIGTEKASKVLKNAIMFGYISDYGKYYIANKLKLEYDNTKINLETITLKSVRKELIKLTILNHIAVNEKVRSLKEMTRNPKTLKQYKTAKVLMDKWNVNKFETTGGLSYSAIAIKANVSVNTAIQYIKQLVAQNKITKKTFKLDFFNVENMGKGINVFEYKGILFCQQSNEYSLVIS